MKIVRQPLRYIESLCRETTALVLAGGRSSERQVLARLRAPPAMSYGGKYRVVDFSLSNCMNSGIRRVGVATQYEAVELTSHIQRAWGHLRGEMGEWVGLLPARQRQERDDWYKGTADAVYQNLGVLEEQDPRYLLVLAGDQVYTMDYHPLLEHHVASGADVTIGAASVDAAAASRLGVIDCDAHGRIDRFVEKPADPEALAGPDGRVLASMGIYVFDFRRLRDILAMDAANPASGHDFGRDVIPALIEGGYVGCHPFVDPAAGRPGYWRDVGTVDAYYRGQMELIEPVPRLNLYDERWPIWSYEAHLPPAKLAPDAAGNSGMSERSILASGSIVEGGEVRGCVLSYGARVEQSEAERCVLLPGSRVRPGCRLRHVIIDEDVVLPPGTEIGYDAAADRARFHVTEGGAILVTRAMAATLSASPPTTAARAPAAEDD